MTADRRLLDELISQLRNPDLAFKAVDELCLHGWLTDGSLRGVNLSGCDLSGTIMYAADLEGADLSHGSLNVSYLSGANLRNANLTEANLMGADLGQVNFENAVLTRAILRAAILGRINFQNADLRAANMQRTRYVSIERLSKAYAMRHAILPDGNLYDGRFNLVGDILAAQEAGINLDDPLQREAFYKLPDER